ncbi:hypothetical protein CRUP_031137, partial [Coryphaenoides rupestris]
MKPARAEVRHSLAELRREDRVMEEEEEENGRYDVYVRRAGNRRLNSEMAKQRSLSMDFELRSSQVVVLRDSSKKACRSCTISGVLSPSTASTKLGRLQAYTMLLRKPCSDTHTAWKWKTR